MLKLSFSQWEAYNTCPRKWDYQSLQRLPRGPAGPAASRGTDIHAQIEAYIKAPDGFVPPYPVEHYREVLDAFRGYEGANLYLEYKCYFDPEWYAVNRDHPERKWTIIFDALRLEGNTGYIGEWKTGKPKDTHRDQRTIYALAAARKFGLDKIIATTYYFDNTSAPQRTSVADTAIPKLIKIWDQRAYQMEHDDFRPPRPGYYCNWCDYAKDKGGPCEFGGGKAPVKESSKIFVSNPSKNLTPLSGPKSKG